MKFLNLQFFYCFLLLFSFLISFSQQFLLLENQKNYLAERLLDSSVKFHSSIKPFLWDPAQQSKSSSIDDSTLKIDSENKINSLTFQKKLNFCGIPALNFTGGYELNNSNTTFESSTGLWGSGNIITPKIYYSLIFAAAYSSFPTYIDTFVKQTSVVPGLGRAYNSDKTYSYQYFSGYFSYSPNKIFNFQIGKDKHFLGDGYRSLFLSDVSNSFPFLKISTTVWKLKYVNLFAQFKDITASPLKNDFKNKYGTFHYLSWNVTHWLNMVLFESILWQGDDDNRSRGFDVNYLNPVIFCRPVEYSIGSSDNAFLGFSFKVKAAKKQQFYGQIILDEFLLKEVKAMKGWWANKQGGQLGFKCLDLFTLTNLTLQTEINAVRPYTYSHGSVQQNYGHYNQPLAHPLGANFAESVSFLNYQYKKWMFETEFLYAIYGKDENGKNWGQNIFESYATHPNEYGNKFFQGLKTNLFYTRFKVAYYIIPSADLLAEAGVAVRQEKNAASSLGSNFFFIGIKTEIMNRYSDF